jgi:hypothetical protein
MAVRADFVSARKQWGAHLVVKTRERGRRWRSGCKRNGRGASGA